MVTESVTTRPHEPDWGYADRVATLFGLFTAVAAVGWLVSVFLTGIHIWALPLPAGVEPSGSMLVITSEYAYLFGVPLALFGAFYYLTTIALAGLWFETRHPFLVKLLTPVTASGVFASAVFVYLQIGVIGAICPFCMVSAAATATLFGLELAILRTSTLPPTRELLVDPAAIVRNGSLTWLVMLVAVGTLSVVAFYAVTLAPVPGA
ncbi:vitamin K epoxide reductase family protein [Natronorarus salvus]|uniref:vitamin K epoxide reductase family protein n=1 Tax=Natronorarus salvus TaxID=3117733 RepID=UPI002F26A73C